MTKLDEAKELFYLYKLSESLKKECASRLRRFTPEGQEEELQETIRKVAELELVFEELKTKVGEWDDKYPANAS